MFKKNVKYIPSEDLLLKCKILETAAHLPTKSYEGDAGWDLYSVDDVVIHPGEQCEVRTGIVVEIPKGWHIQLRTRSSYGKRGLWCFPGTIDEGYRNELTIWLAYLNLYRRNTVGGYDCLESFEIKKGAKICQMIILPVPKVKIVEVDELSKSERGLKGHGSSGR